MAIVLAIIAMLLGGMLPLISGQMEQARRTETRKHLDEIKEALIGYAIINGYLPCPTTTTDPTSANYGVADASCSSAPTSEGILPWKTLGVSEMDAWGSKRLSSGDSWPGPGYWRYRVDRSFVSTFSLSTTFTDSLVIQDNSGNSITTTSERPAALVYSTGPDITADGANTTFDATYQSDVPSSSFDDILIWVSRPQLFNRMVMAGKLP